MAGILDALGPIGSIAGAALGAGAGLLGQSQQAQSDAAIAKYNTDATNAANARMAQNAFDQNKSMWMENNAYNSPSEQMARLKSAGLNPNLVYGGNAVGNSSGGIPTFVAPRQSYDYKSPNVAGAIPQGIASFMGLQMQQAQLDNVKAQTDATNVKTANDMVAGRILSNTEDVRTTGVRDRGTIDRFKADTIRNNGRAFQDFQLQALQQGARRSQLTNDKIFQDVMFRKYQNEWAKEGITSSDNALLRMLSRHVGSDDIIAPIKEFHLNQKFNR